MTIKRVSETEIVTDRASSASAVFHAGRRRFHWCGLQQTDRQRLLEGGRHL